MDKELQSKEQDKKVDIVEVQIQMINVLIVKELVIGIMNVDNPDKEEEEI